MTTKKIGQRVMIDHHYGHRGPGDRGLTVRVSGKIIDFVRYNLDGRVRRVPIVRYAIPRGNGDRYVLRDGVKTAKRFTREAAFELVGGFESMTLVEADREKWEAHLIYSPDEDLAKEG